MLKLSIITINYNNLDGLKRTIRSVVNQTWRDFEYIIIDGGSTDGSVAYIESQSANINYWVSEPDNGIYNAINKGIVKSTGEYLLFLNSGDHLYNDFVLYENQGQIVNHDLIYFNIELADAKTSRIVSYPQKLNFSFFYKGTLCHQSTFIKKVLFDELGLYDENFKLVSDWKFFILALFKYNCSYLKVDTTLATYYLDGISSNWTNKKMLTDERQRVLNKDFNGFIEDMNQLLEFKRIVLNLRNSKKIKFFTRLGLLNKF
ncbi:glycosyltransferase [Flavobacterium aquariorum]|uniref:Glycosyltransferase n=1 Tax=Flavobacterium aquariorum TaxID=2217670 RepID=A0A2W7VJJ3_9FLAO|nr:glycosyltransferase family 2 protein [Flavobacterium aquariorum]PZX92462.1 glycosyltransferase [Flavobacterium aquariorum]